MAIRKVENEAREDDTILIENARSNIKQFSEIKRALINFVLNDQGKSILASPIVQGIITEMRVERKILMVIDNYDMDLYVSQDLSKIDISEEAIANIEDPKIKKVA